MSIRVACNRCDEVVVTTAVMPLSKREIAALAAHVRACARIAPAERPAGSPSLAQLLPFFDVDIQLG